ncbi:MAG TPA: GlsB/YeaQ/YmgE family stress response membrane protein [Longimicrobiaceae bacterium]|nr:GlsB/YeaQ/YmgE family stress response membrane protein [Longimicrobiaceae bacterium]
MEFIWMLIIGLIAGAIAKLLMPGRDPGGIIVTILLGIAGSFVGGFLANMLGLGDGNSTAGLIGSVVGAMILLFIYERVTGGSDRSGPAGPAAAG